MSQRSRTVLEPKNNKGPFESEPAHHLPQHAALPLLLPFAIWLIPPPQTKMASLVLSAPV